MRIERIKFKLWHDAGALIGWLVLCHLVALFASQFSPGIWYEQLEKPPWQPPDWLFAPVWIFLYTLMGVSAWLVWRAKGFARAPLALVLFITQLVFNAAWSWFFFGLQQPGMAFLEITILWLLIVATMIAFWHVRPVAGILFIPYLLWVTFAALLNYALWQLNA